MSSLAFGERVMDNNKLVLLNFFEKMRVQQSEFLKNRIVMTGSDQHFTQNFLRMYFNNKKLLVIYYWQSVILIKLFTTHIKKTIWMSTIFNEPHQLSLSMRFNSLNNCSFNGDGFSFFLVTKISNLL